MCCETSVQRQQAPHSQIITLIIAGAGLDGCVEFWASGRWYDPHRCGGPDPFGLKIEVITLVFFLVLYFWAPFAVYACFRPASLLSDWDVRHGLILLTTLHLLRTNWKLKQIYCTRPLETHGVSWIIDHNLSCFQRFHLSENFIAWDVNLLKLIFSNQRQ